MTVNKQESPYNNFQHQKHLYSILESNDFVTVMLFSNDDYPNNSFLHRLIQSYAHAE